MEEKEKISEIVATYPSGFVGTAIGGTIFEFICMIVCIVAAPPEQKLLLIALLCIITTILVFISIAFKRYKVIVNSEGITETPLFGKRKFIHFNEIRSIQIKGSKAILILGNGVKICIDPSAVGHKEIFNVFYENGLIKSSFSK